MEAYKKVNLNVKNDHKFTLNNNVQIPTIGIGTGIISLVGVKSIIVDVVIRKGEQTKNAYKLKKVINRAPKVGCFMFDTSKAYGKSEYILGKSVKRFNRKDMFIITKLTNTDQRKGDVRKAFMHSMKALGVDYIDLYLIHWPQTDTYINCWLQMQELYNEGLVKAIGVSNFHKQHLDNLLSVATVVPAVNEFERHPLLNQKELVQYCENLGIKVIAYTPIGRMHKNLQNNHVLLNLSQKYNKTIPQIILRWHNQQGIITIPHTLKVRRLEEYMDIFDFELLAEEIDDINNINENLRLRYDPDNCDFSKL